MWLTAIVIFNSGPVVALQLVKDNAFKAWRDLIGPANSKRAKEDAPQTYETSHA